MPFKLHILFCLLFFAPFALAHRDLFKYWYPEYRIIWDRILRENCSSEYAYYLAGQKNETRYLSEDLWTGSTPTSQMVFPVASCVLNHASEWMKTNMAAAAVLLGLTPTILGLIGPTVEEMATLFVIARRPLLGTCLGAAAPSLYPFRTIDYHKLFEDLTTQDGHVRPPQDLYPGTHYMIMALEFALAAAAIVNNALNSYQLGMQTSCVFAPHLWFLCMMWAFLGVLAHLYGSWALWLRVDSRKPYRNPYNWFKIQFTPLALQDFSRPTIVKNNLFFSAVSFWVSINITCHIIFGTLLFSGLVFITVRDALTVIARYMASLLVVRAILMYELVVLRDKLTNARANGERVDEELRFLSKTDRSDTDNSQEIGFHLSPPQEVRYAF